MYSKAFLASTALLMTSVTAQSTPTTSPTSSTDDVLSLVSQLPTCAVGCLDDAATNINCTVTDVTCLCSKSSQLVAAIGPCLLLSSGCSTSDTNQIGVVAQRICTDVDLTNSSEVADASRAISAALATSTADNSNSTTNMAVASKSPIAGMGILGFLIGVAMVVL